MADRNEKLLLELLKRPGNNVCADCGSKSKMCEASLSYCLTDVTQINHTFVKSRRCRRNLAAVHS